MADRFYGEVVAGATGISLDVVLRSATDSSAVTGVAAGSVTAVYYRQGAAASVAVTVSALAAPDAAYVAGGWREISAANFPGRYRFDLPDAAIAVGTDWIGVQIRVAGAFVFDSHLNLQSAALFPDQIFKRDVSQITGEASRSLLNAMRLLRNRWTILAGILSVKREDDATEAWNATLTTTAGAAPITATDPS